MEVVGVKLEFVLYAVNLAGVAVFHYHTHGAALTGSAVLTH